MAKFNSSSKKNCSFLSAAVKYLAVMLEEACKKALSYTNSPSYKNITNLINRLATCEYIAENRNVFIIGATGSRKTYMTCAFGMEAYKQYFTVKYVQLPDLLVDLQTARDEDNLVNVLKKYTKTTLLLLDEWLLIRLNEAEARNLFELIHKRRKKASTLFCSQLREAEWYDHLCNAEENTLADTIMDRTSYDSYKINIESIEPSKDISIREVYGLEPAQTE